MDECVVTKNAVVIIKRNLVRAKKECSDSRKVASQQHTEVPTSSDMPALSFAQMADGFPEGMEVTENGGDQFLHLDCQPLDDGQLLFGTQWSNSLNLLGTSWGTMDN